MSVSLATIDTLLGISARLRRGFIVRLRAGERRCFCSPRLCITASLRLEHDIGNRMHLPYRGNIGAQVFWAGMTGCGVRDIEEQRASDFDRNRRAIEMVGWPRQPCAGKWLISIAGTPDAGECLSVFLREPGDLP